VSSLSRLVLAVCGGDPMTKRWLPLLAWLAAVGLPSVAAAQPVGPEFQVNTYTTENQWYPAVSSDAIGNFVVVWAGAGQGDSRGIFGQRYDNSGNSLGAEFSVSVGFFSYYQQNSPSVASDANANFVVVWTSEGQDDPHDFSGEGVFAQRFNSSGNRLGGEFRVN